MRVKKAVIPAAGLGTRFLPATKAQPKEMLPIIDTPVIQYVVQEAIDAGIKDILVVTGRHKRAIEDHFDYSVELEAELARDHKDELLDIIRDVANMVDIHFIRQKRPLGLGHAIYCARQHIGNEPFAVLLGDEVYEGNPSCLAQLLELHGRTGATVLATQPVPASQVQRYGIIAGTRVENRLHLVTDLVEKPSVSVAPSRLAIMGRYIIDPAIFDLLANQAPGANGEIQLTDALRRLNEDHSILAYEFEGKRYDLGEKQSYLQAIVEMALERPDLRDEFAEFLVRVVDSRRTEDGQPQPVLGGRRACQK